MDINKNLNELMKEAQKMQKKMEEAQKQLSELIVTGESGGGMVTVKMNGKHDVLGVVISKSAMEEDEQLLGDLVMAAANDAVRKVEKASKEKIGQLTAGLNIPDGFMDKV